jgi:hypothetical protein
VRSQWQSIRATTQFGLAVAAPAIDDFDRHLLSQSMASAQRRLSSYRRLRSPAALCSGRITVLWKLP